MLMTIGTGAESYRISWICHAFEAAEVESCTGAGVLKMLYHEVLDMGLEDKATKLALPLLD